MLEVPRVELHRMHLNTEGVTSLCYAYESLRVVFHLDTSIVLMSRLMPDRLDVINGFLCSTAV